jgi:hypothetical protein
LIDIFKLNIGVSFYLESILIDRDLIPPKVLFLFLCSNTGF